MAPQRMAIRVFLAVAAATLLLPPTLGLRCDLSAILPGQDGSPGPSPSPSPSPSPEPGDDEGDGSSQISALSVSAGIDRAATVGEPITLVGSVSGGVEPYQIEWTGIDVIQDARTITPTVVPDTIGLRELTLTVTDAEGAVGTSRTTLQTTSGATLSSLKWAPNYAGGGYMVLAAFTAELNKTSAENTTRYRVSTALTPPTSATLRADNRTVELIFDTTPLAASTAFDISVNGGVLDAQGNIVPLTLGLPAIANTADLVVPTITTIAWAANAGQYMVELTASEAMDRATVENPAAYRIQEDVIRKAPSSVMLGSNARTITLLFDDIALSSAGARLDLALETVRDVNGRILARRTAQAISASAADTQVPTLVDDGVLFFGDVQVEGYQLTCEFNEVMDKTSAEVLSQYVVDGTPATGAELMTDGRTVLVTFAGAVLNADSVLDITGGQARDINGQILAAVDDIAIGAYPGAVQVSPAPTLTWMNGADSTGYQLRALFPVNMDTATVEDVTNWEIAGTSTNPVTVVLSQTDDVMTGAIAGRTATLTFDNVVMGRSTKLDVSTNAAAPIKTINGAALPETTTPIGDNPEDTISPTVVAPPGSPPGGSMAAPIFGDLRVNSYGGMTTVISVIFSETMDGDSAGNAENYELIDGAGNRTRPSDVTLNDTLSDTGLPAGRVAVLTFNVAGQDDGLRLYGAVRDINGRAFAGTTFAAIQGNFNDSTNPTIEYVRWETDASPYKVVIKFSEAVSRPQAETASNYRLGEDPNGVEDDDWFAPETATLAADGMTLTLSFHEQDAQGVDPAPSVTTGWQDLGISDTHDTFRPTDELQIAAAAIKDLNGNELVDATYVAPASGAPAQNGAEDTQGPEIVQVIWKTGGFDGNSPDNDTYVVFVDFNEAIDESAIGTYDIDGVVADAVDETFFLRPGGTRVMVTFLTNGGPFRRGLKLTATDVGDMHGNTNTSTLVISPNPDDESGPNSSIFSPAEAFWVVDYGTGGEDGYQLTVTFDEVLDEATAENPFNYQIQGTFSKPSTAELADTTDTLNTVEIFRGRTVTLTFAAADLSGGLGVSDRLQVSLNGSILDINGRPAPQQTVFIRSNDDDAGAPTVVGAMATDQFEVAVMFNEAMDRVSVETLANYRLSDGPSEPIAAELLSDGQIVLLTFPVEVAGDDLLISVGDSITDINGVPVVETTEFGM